MTQPTPLSLSQLHSELSAHNVSFTLEPNGAASKAPTLLATYVELPTDKPILARVDRSAVAVLAGTLLGIPDTACVERAGETPRNEPVWDGMHEILNITSSALSTDGRVVLKRVLAAPGELTAAEQEILQNPKLVCNYGITVDGKRWGQMTLFC